MEEEIKAKFEEASFSLEDEEEILKKCKIYSFGSEFRPLILWLRILMPQSKISFF